MQCNKENIDRSLNRDYLFETIIATTKEGNFEIIIKK